MIDTELLVIGAGPYALATAALARDRGIDTTVVGRSMGFWREHMPANMFLRSGPDWHLDGAGVDTLQAYLAERQIDPDDIDPIPIGLFLDYAAWFTARKGLPVREELVVELEKLDARFDARLDSGEAVRADFVVAAPGIRQYTQVPEWAASVPAARSAHTCDLVDLSELSGARVVIIGGRQSAYEWAALLCEHGAERIDVVHRHDVPRFERVSWKFVDEHVERTLAVPGYWRNLPDHEQEAIDRRFWEVGRLTLEHWLAPRLDSRRVTRWPGTEVTEVIAGHDGDGMRVVLSNAQSLTADFIVFACGYAVDLGKVPYLRGCSIRWRWRTVFRCSTSTSKPRWTGSTSRVTRRLETSVRSLDSKGSPAAADTIVRDLVAKSATRAGQTAAATATVFDPPAQT